MIKVIGSSSAGNAVLYDKGKIMVDCGLPFKTVQPHLDKVRLVLLTHIHGDHFAPSTIATICALYPKITWMVPNYMEKEFLALKKPHTRVVITKTSKEYVAGPYLIKVLPLFHDVPNVGYSIIINNGYKIVHATDTNMIRHLQDVKGYDLYAIECNHDENIIYDKIKSSLYDESYTYEISSRENHLSFQKTISWFKEVRKEDSILYPLHVSHSYDDELVKVIMNRLLKPDHDIKE